jgi:ribosomal protein S27AE
MSYAAKVRKAEQKRVWRKENPDESRKRGRTYSQRYRENNAIKCHARYEVRKALRLGILKKKPCEICGNPRAEAHHDDYTKPLDVRWLCKDCHDDVHAGRLSILFIQV